MKKVQFKESKPINKRANAKAVTIAGRHFLIGSFSKSCRWLIAGRSGT